MNRIAKPLLLPAAALALMATGCASNTDHGRARPGDQVETPGMNPVEPGGRPVTPGLQSSAAPATRPVAAVALALSVTPPLVAYDDGPAPDLSRLDRGPAAYAGYDTLTESSLFVYTLDRTGGTNAYGRFGGGGGNRYERRATSYSTQVQVR